MRIQSHSIDHSSSIAHFKLYDDDKLAIVCSSHTELGFGQPSETLSMNTNDHQSNLMIVSFKALMESQSMDSVDNNASIILSQPLKDIPAKLTVDGRRNLIAVVRTMSSPYLRPGKEFRAVRQRTEKKHIYLCIYLPK